MINREIISPDTQRENRIPPGQRATEKWPVLHYGQAPLPDAAGWTFTVSGLVEKEFTLTLDEFKSLPQVKIFSDVHCVTRWSKLNNHWEGVSTSVLAGMVKILPEAKFLIIEAAGGFTTNLSLDDFFQPDVLFALKHNGEPLTTEHGSPVRLVVPRLYFWKSAKWVTGIKFVSSDRPGFWESAGYHNHGDPWREERYCGD